MRKFRLYLLLLLTLLVTARTRVLSHEAEPDSLSLETGLSPLYDSAVVPVAAPVYADTLSALADTLSQKDYVYLLHADKIEFKKLLNPDAQILRGNVVFRHDSMYMYCDSALFYQKQNSFQAYNNVRIEQGDTLFLYGDSLFYNGDERMARVRSHVRVENNTMVLLTDSLNYDRNLNLGYFFEGGTLMDETNTLTSEYGEYETVMKLAAFYHNVRLQSEDYEVETDTLYYDTDRKLVYFTTETKIMSEATLITTRRGNLDTDTKQAILLDRSLIVRNEGLQTMTADSIRYDDLNSYVEGFGDAQIHNYEDHADISGDYLYFNSERDSAVVTGRALAVEYSSQDSLFIHADTFRLQTFTVITERLPQTDSVAVQDTLPAFMTFNDSLPALSRQEENLPSDTLLADNFTEEILLADSSGEASGLLVPDTLTYREIRAFRKVKAFRNDIQMIADSLVFSSLDSCLTLYKDPIVWMEGGQLLGEVIKVYMNDSTVEWAHVIDQTLFAQRLDSIRYNQVAGRQMKAYFRDGDIYRTDVDGNVLVVYYPVDSDGTMIGMNTTTASFLSMFFEEREVCRMVITQSSNGVMYPISETDPSRMYLSNFKWFDMLRPFSQYDIFYWRGKQSGDKLKQSVHREVPLPTLPTLRTNK